MEQTLRARTAAVIAFALLPACLPKTRPPPTAGYGPPFRGTGQEVCVHDSRGDWKVEQGFKVISSEQALELTGDPVYEQRRQLARAYNLKLYDEGQRNRTRGKLMMGTGVAMFVAGTVLGLIVPRSLQEVETTPPTAMEPEMRVSTNGAAATMSGLGFFGMMVVGVGAVSYGYIGGRKQPPYHTWRTPRGLDRPAYVRQHAEAYDEKLGKRCPDRLADQEDLGPAPGERKAPPPKPTGGRR